MTNKRSKYDEAFKTDLVLQVLDGGKSALEVSAEASVDISTLYGWIRRYRAATKRSDSGAVFPGNGKLTNQEDEIRKLRRRVAQLEEERTILKKATVFFAKETK